MFIRGFRVARTLRILPKHLEAAADSLPGPEGHDSEPDNELISIPATTKVGLRLTFLRPLLRFRSTWILFTFY